MCSPRVIEASRAGISRRNFLKLADVATIGTAAAATTVRPARAQTGIASVLGDEFTCRT